MYLSALGPASAYFQSSGVSWYWSPRRAQWWAQSGFSQYRDQPPGHIEAPTSWDASATLGRVLGRSYVLSFSYTMARTGARRYIFEGRHYQLHETGARVSFAWNPFARQGLR